MAGDKIMEARRAKFEAHMRIGGYSNPAKNPDGSYVSSAMELWWQGWSAALDSLCVKLPDMMGLGEKFTGTPISEIRAHNHFNAAITQCREAIHTAGVKTK